MNTDCSREDADQQIMKKMKNDIKLEDKQVGSLKKKTEKKEYVQF